MGDGAGELGQHEASATAQRQSRQGLAEAEGSQSHHQLPEYEDRTEHAHARVGAYLERGWRQGVGH